MPERKRSEYNVGQALVEGQAFKKWEYGKSDEETCGWMADKAREKEFGSVHRAARCQYRTCKFCYICQGDEVEWSDGKTRRSHGGYILFLNGGCVSWKIGLQKIVTLSSCES